MIKKQITVDYTIVFTQEGLKELYDILYMSKEYDRLNELRPLYNELNKMYHTQNDHL